jgi:hypothetical protein
MEWLSAFVIIGCAMGLAAIGVVAVATWRIQGLFGWRRDIEKEIEQLKIEAEAATPARKRAIEVILARCDETLCSLSPEVGDLERLRSYLTDIAACFFPDSPHPERQVSLGSLIRSLKASLSRFDQILRRPGLDRVKRLKIRQIHALHTWSAELMRRPTFRWYVSHRRLIKRISHIRLVIFPDPVSLLLFFSQRLVTLVILRNLLADSTLFVGKLALNAYDCSRETPTGESDEFMEATLEDLSQMEEPSTTLRDPRILEIRKELLNFPAVMFSAPTWADWKEAIRKSASIIARNHFPESDNPLAEAAIGPLLHRIRWRLDIIAKGEETRVVRYVYKLRLDTLFQAKDVTDLILPVRVRRFVRYGFTAYGWLKWPWKLYRWSKRATLPGIAVNLGWTFGRRSIAVFMYGRAFDQLSEEIDWVYKLSKQAATSPP